MNRSVEIRARHSENSRAARPVTGQVQVFTVRGRPVSVSIEVAASLRARAVGWLGRRQAPIDHGLWLLPCNAVHTCTMRFPIDLLFLGRGGRVLRIDSQVPPWRFRIRPGAHSVVELPAGDAARLGIRVGDCLERRAAQ